MHPWNPLSLRAAAAGLFGAVAITAYAADHKPGARPADSEPAPGTYETLPTGFRKVNQTTRVTMTPAQIQRFQADGKPITIDPATGEVLIASSRFYLPENWRWDTSEDWKADSLGHPIISQALALPDWTQQDVNDLAALIREHAAACAAARAAGQDTRELEGYLGNFIAQGVIRHIALEGVVDLADQSVMTDGVVRSVLSRLHSYENQKYTYSPTTFNASQYGPQVAALAVRAKLDIADVLAIEPGVSGMGEEGGIASAPSGCYYKEALAPGMDFLSGATILFDANGVDDASADVQLPFYFQYFTCDTLASWNTLRVSTNGYVCFAQASGNSSIGDVYQNDPIPTVGNLDGMIAGWWDDLQVMQNQGAADRIQYKIFGSSPTRSICVEYYSMSRRNGDTTDFHNFQIWLFEQGSQILLAYPEASWNGDSADSATVGIEAYNGTDGECGPSCGATINTLPPNNYRFTPLANDRCTESTNIALYHRHDGTLLGALSDGATTCSTQGNPDVYYRVVATCAGTLTVTTCGTHDAEGVDTGPDTVLSLHSTCPATIANTLDCNDDDQTANCSQQGNHRDSRVSAHVAAGQIVVIRVSHWNTAIGTGKFQLHSWLTPDAALSNDECGNAQLVFPNQELVGSLACATPSLTAGVCGASNDNRDVWYKIVAPRNGKLRVTACGTHDHGGVDSGMDPVVSLYAGCPLSPSDDGSIWNCNDDPASGDPCGARDDATLYDSIVTKSVATGEMVLVRVSHFGSSLDSGWFQVQFGFIVKGDMNCDGLFNNFDIDPFVLALTQPALWQLAYPNCNILNGDVDGNDRFDNFDIDPFVMCVSNLACP